jgi:hypothetical protein
LRSEAGGVGRLSGGNNARGHNEQDDARQTWTSRVSSRLNLSPVGK